MTRWPRLYKLLTGHEPDSCTTARAKALEAYEAARKAGDKREMHRTWLQLRAATCTALRAQ